MKVTILWGLPGSGKTTYAEKAAKETIWSGYSRPKTGISILSLDGKSPQNIEDNIEYNLASNWQKLDHLIVDGLVTTNTTAVKIMSLFRKKSRSLIDFEIQWWVKDVEACLHNDRGRRSQRSNITIETMAFEEPNPEILGVPKNKIHRHDVVRKSEAEAWADETLPHSNRVLKSERWCLGGTWGDCYGGHGNVSGETPPTSFNALDELLEKICPNIPFLQYRLIYNKLVKTEEDGESDYYGGHREYAYYSCNLIELYDELRERNLIVGE